MTQHLFRLDDVKLSEWFTPDGNKELIYCFRDGLDDPGAVLVELVELGPRQYRVSWGENRDLEVIGLNLDHERFVSDPWKSAVAIPMVVIHIRQRN